MSDHPSAPIGEAWGQRLALVPQCMDPGGARLVEVGRGCRETDVCASGLCHGGRCAELCDPDLFDPCFAADCVEVRAERKRPGGASPVFDKVHICSG